MDPKRVQRRLAAILMADVVGYSRLMGVDEAGTVATLKGHWSEIWLPAVAEHTSTRAARGSAFLWRENALYLWNGKITRK